MSNNYIKKNLRTLRRKVGLTTDEFGALFDLTRDNIKSYERGINLRVDKYLEIMRYFYIDPDKFERLDMEMNDVYLSDERTAPSSTSAKPTHHHDLGNYIPESKQYKYLDDTPRDTLTKLCKSLLRSKEETNRQLIDCQTLIIQLQKEVIQLKGALTQKEDNSY